jgi:Molecular chaperone, HSP90 family
MPIFMTILVPWKQEEGSEAGVSPAVSFRSIILILCKIFYLAELGKSPEDLGKSVFVEKLKARGYEVLLLNEPLDEILIQNIRQFK